MSILQRVTRRKRPRTAEEHVERIAEIVGEIGDALRKQVLAEAKAILKGTPPTKRQIDKALAKMQAKIEKQTRNATGVARIAAKALLNAIADEFERAAKRL